MKFADDEQLDNLEKFKSAELIKAIAECNLLLQLGAFIVIPDPDNKRMIIKDSWSLYKVMNYLNYDTIPKESLIEEMYKAYYCYVDKTKKKNNCEKFYLRNTVFLLEKILSENSLFRPYIAKKCFLVSEMKNKKEVDKGESLYLSQVISSADNKMLYVVFNFDTGQWLYLNEEDMKNLEEIKEFET